MNTNTHVSPHGYPALALLVLVPVALSTATAASVPIAPVDVRHTASSPAHLRVEWSDRAADETGYRIWRRVAGEPGWFLAGQTAANTTHFEDGGMQQQTRYEHKVAAFNAAGESPGVETAAAGRTQRMLPHLTPKVIRPGDQTYAAAPSALALRNGNLMLVYATGSIAQRRQRMNQALWQVESSDRGETWSEPRLMFEGDLERSYGKPALARLPDGSIGFSFSRFGLDAEYKINNRERHFVRSTDEGRSWSKPVQVSDSMSANNDTLIVGESGRILQALSSYAPAAQIVASDDRGATWLLLAEVSAKRC